MITVEEQTRPTLKSQELEELMDEISEFLKELTNEKNLVQYYWELSQKAEHLILFLLGEEAYHFPINIEKMAENMGLTIVEENLSGFSNQDEITKRSGQIIIREDFFTDETSAIIYLDEDISPISKRYVIAYELAHYIMHWKERRYNEDYCIMPLCPIDIEKIVADIFANFLLIPVKLFFQEFYDYVFQRTQQERIPIATEYWIRYLSERSLVPEYYVAYGYQQLRYVGYWIYQAWTSEENMQDHSVTMSAEEKEQIKKATEGYFNEAIMKLLFQ